ncbi:hypothetical protein K0M31_002700 [Melipona bicolor]|uniref:Uncharacterized protein n=1 Tax=Melipona bicolor TaxID=60889 RepID=A0AA40G045_9HYME|nr:hypothetical protein K0M31_002700 [Melipona bicolor]
MVSERNWVVSPSLTMPKDEGQKYPAKDERPPLGRSFYSFGPTNRRTRMTSERIDNSARYILARRDGGEREGEGGKEGRKKTRKEGSGRWRRQAKRRRIVGIKPTTSEFDIGRSLNLTRPTRRCRRQRIQRCGQMWEVLFSSACDSIARV